MNNIEKVLNSKLKNKILDFIIKISENIGKVESKFSLDMIFGLLSSGNILLSEIGRGLKEKINIKQTEKRLSNNLLNFKEEYIHELRDMLLVNNKKIIKVITNLNPTLKGWGF